MTDMILPIPAVTPRSRRSQLPPVPTWTCPHCGFIHKPVDLVRLNSDRLQCNGCLKPFDAVSDVMRERKKSEA